MDKQFSWIDQNLTIPHDHSAINETQSRDQYPSRMSNIQTPISNYPYSPKMNIKTPMSSNINTPMKSRMSKMTNRYNNNHNILNIYANNNNYSNNKYNKNRNQKGKFETMV